jgi:hypothetical protein
MERKHDLRSLLLRYFLVLLILVSIVAVIVIIIGAWANQPYIVGFGSSLFAAVTVGLIYRVLGYSAYLQELNKAVFERQALSRLDQDELKDVIRKSLEAFEKSRISPEIYDAIFDRVIGKTGGPFQNNKSCAIVLEHCTKYGSHLLWVRKHVSTVYSNPSLENKPIFENDIVARGIVRFPSLPEVPKNPVELCSFGGLEIDGKRVDPDQLTIDWLDGNDQTKGIRYEIKYRKILDPQGLAHVSYEIGFLSSPNDFIAMRLDHFVKDVEVIVTHPQDIQAQISWFTEAAISNPVVSPVMFLQKSDGILFPNDGFVILFSPKGEGENGRSAQMAH